MTPRTTNKPRIPVIETASAIERLNTKIDDKTDALALQITNQHTSLSQQIFEVLKTVKGSN